MKSQKTKSYEKGRIAADPVIFTIKEQKLWVYLTIREIEPYKNLAELPGGLLFENETAEETLARKLTDIIGANIFFQQFYTFTKPKRDPRVRTVSIGFIALVSSDKLKISENFYELNKLPKLAFDHQEIVASALEYLKHNLSNVIVRQIMPASFPLNDLQKVYEVIGQKKLDNRNFRKKILNSGIVKKIKRIQKNVTHRPAVLYQFTQTDNEI
jgi:8-oxo-dGTP diphosphatase